MDKITPESFGATQASRIKHLVAAYSKPVRIELLTGVIDHLDKMNAQLAESMESTPVDPSSEATSPGSQEGGDDAATSPAPGLSDPTGAEVATAPGEPGVVTPGA